MKPTISTGLDYINMATIKVLEEVTEPVLAHPLIAVINTGIYPSNQKLRRIIPTHKPSEDINYPLGSKPINLLNALSKCTVKELYHQIMIYLEGQDIIPENIHGARRSHSIVTAATSIHRKMVHLRYSKTPSALVAVNKSSAYDCIKH